MNKRETLIGLIYAGVEDKTVWSAVLAEVAKLLRAAGAGIGLQDMATHEFRAVAQSGIDPGMSDAYRRFAPENVVWQTIARTGQPVADSMVLSKQDFRRTSLHGEWFVPLGFDSVMAAPVLASGSQSGVVVTFGSRPREFQRSDVQSLAGLARHVGLALRLRASRMQILGDLQDRQRLLDAMQDALLIIDSGLRIRDANRAARRLLDRGDGVRDHNGRLGCLNPQEQAELLAMVRPKNSRPGLSAGGWMVVPRAEGRPLLLEITALHGAAGLGDRAASFGVRIRMPDYPQAATVLQLQRLLDVELPEAKAIRAVVQSANQVEAARRFGRRLSTLRTYLHRAYAKLDVHSDAELTRLLARYGFVQGPE